MAWVWETWVSLRKTQEATKHSTNKNQQLKIAGGKIILKQLFTASTF